GDGPDAPAHGADDQRVCRGVVVEGAGDDVRQAQAVLRPGRLRAAARGRREHAVDAAEAADDGRGADDGDAAQLRRDVAQAGGQQGEVVVGPAADDLEWVRSQVGDVGGEIDLVPRDDVDAPPVLGVEGDAVDVVRAAQLVRDIGERGAGLAAEEELARAGADEGDVGEAG